MFFHTTSRVSGATITSIGLPLYVSGADVETVTGVIVLKVTNPVDDMEGRVTLSTTTSVHPNSSSVLSD
jgi:hypothetical protein